MYENTSRIVGTEPLRIILHEKSSGGKRAAEKTAMPYISAAFVLYFQVITDILGTKKLPFASRFCEMVFEVEAAENLRVTGWK